MDDGYKQSIAQLYERLNTNSRGLLTLEAERRLRRDGYNTLPKTHQLRSWLFVFARQWASPLILLLLIAGIVSGAFGEYLDMSIILVTAFINAIIGYVQESKANRALEHLRELVVFPAIVLRDGRKQQIPSEHVVAGDILFLQPGDKIVADGRIIESEQLMVNEASLTGESEPIIKRAYTIKKDTAPFDRKNTVYKGTIVMNGRATILVTAIGIHTEIGQVARLVSDTKEEKTPLQKQISHLGRLLGVLIVLLSGLVFIVGVVFGQEQYDVVTLFTTAVAVAVAAIPEGLAISLTVVLAVGTQYMLQKGALVRKLVAVETLGSISVICCDKTGTLTEGVMKVTQVCTATSQVLRTELQKNNSLDIEKMIRIGGVCNDALLQNPDADSTQWQFVGDTTDIALLRLAMEREVNVSEVSRLHDIPFDSDYKYMATVVKENQSDFFLYVKGASDVLLTKSAWYLSDGKKQKITEKQRIAFSYQESALTKQGLRVIGVAYTPYSEHTRPVEHQDVDELIFIGFVALTDPLREDVYETLRLARNAGIRVIMITGDHVETAKSVAHSLGIPSSDTDVMNGSTLNALSANEFSHALQQVSVFARVDPKHKIKIVEALQARGDVVAMTGDGINDAPALKGADIGIALGSGTDVSRETADVVLTNNALSTIVAAVEQGRVVYQNIQKVIVYLLSGSFAEVVLIGGSIMLGFPIAALPAQILWVNVVVDVILVVIFLFDSGDHDVMQDTPRRRNAPVLTFEMITLIFARSILGNLLLFAIFFFSYQWFHDIHLTRTLVFVGFAIDALCIVFSMRSLQLPLWHIPVRFTPYIWVPLLIGWVALFSAVYIPQLQFVLRTVPLQWYHWLVMFSFGIVNICIIEIVKAIFRRTNNVISG